MDILTRAAARAHGGTLYSEWYMAHFSDQTNQPTHDVAYPSFLAYLNAFERDRLRD